MSERKLAYAVSTGIAHPESAWVNSRMTVFGESKTEAETAIRNMIDNKTIVVIEEKQ